MIKWSQYIKWILTILVFIMLMLLFLEPLLKVSMPFIISLILTYLLSPIVNFFTAHKMPRTLSILVTFLIFLVIAILISQMIFPIIYHNFINVMDKLPTMTEKYRILINEFSIRYELSNIPISFKNSISDNVKYFVVSVNTFIGKFIGMFTGLVTNFFYLVLIPVITFYLLKDAEYLKNKTTMVLPKSIRNDVIIMWYQIDLVLKRFIRGEFIVAVIVGVLTFLGLYLLGVNFSSILAIIAGITNFIPYLGPFIGLVPSMLVAFMQSPFLALKVVLLILLIQQIESSIISPKIVGESVGLHPITIIFSILFAEQVFGIIGMFFAVPGLLILIAILKVILNKFINYRTKF